jgi:hypothetical protein
MATATQVQLRRGTSAQVAAFTGAPGEVVVDTTNSRAVVQDGATAGGWPAAKLYDLPGGMRNRFRNATMDMWQRGTSAISVAAGSSAYTADGWIVAPFGAAVTVQPASGRQLSVNALQITGASGVGDVTLSQKIESYLAAALTSETVTFQAQIYNNTGATITPTLTVRHANAQDNWGGSTVDINAVALQPCANVAWTSVAYTFVAASSAAKGLQITIDLGSNFSTSGKSAQVCELDLRHTAGVPTGINMSPPPVELRPIGIEAPLNYRYLCSSFQNGQTPGAALGANHGEYFIQAILGAGGLLRAPYYQFPVEMRAVPTITIYNPANNNNNAYDADAEQDAVVNNTLPTTKGYGLIVTSPSGGTVGNKISWHWQATAEL